MSLRRTFETLFALVLTMAGCVTINNPQGPTVTVTTTAPASTNPDATTGGATSASTGSESPAPAFNLQPDESTDKLYVESAALNANWNRLQIKVGSCTGGATARVWIGGLAGATHVNAAGRASASSAPLIAAAANCGGAATPEQAAPSSAKMVANDYLQFCGAGSITNVKIVLTDTTSDVLAYSFTFTDLANCT
jgi:hypothetical protein